MGPLILRLFSVVNTIVLHNLRMTESSDAESQIQRNTVSEGQL